MIDVDKQVTFWRSSALEDWDAARALIRQKRTRHGLFFAHLAFEKVIKAHVCRTTQDLAPRIHNLVRLAELAQLPLSNAQVDLLAEMNSFNIEGRYPDSLALPPTLAEAQAYLARSEPVFQWLISQL